MPDEANDTGSGNGQIDVAAITKAATEAAVKAVTEQYGTKLADLEKNVGIIGDTLKALPPAAADKNGKKDEKAADALTPDAVSKIVQDAIAADRAAREEAAAKDNGRKEIISKIVKEKLGGDEDLASLLSGDDEAALLASADKVTATVKKFKPDFGGATKDGGTPPGGDKQPPAPIGNLSPGTARFAAGIKVPA